LKLVSPFDGVVSMIQRGPGETVLAGEPILTVAAKEPVEVVAYASEIFADSVAERMAVRVMKKSGAAQDSQVTEVGPTVEQKPARMWQNPNIPEWGRPILIKAPPNLELTPGELVGIKRLR
jgi:multidrug resistance efflux pump